MMPNSELEAFERVGNEWEVCMSHNQQPIFEGKTWQEREFHLTVFCKVEGRVPGMRAASESTGETDNCAKRMNVLRQRLCVPPSLGSYSATSELMNGLSYTTIIKIAEPLASRCVPPGRDLDH